MPLQEAGALRIDMGNMKVSQSLTSIGLAVALTLGTASAGVLTATPAVATSNVATAPSINIDVEKIVDDVVAKNPSVLPPNADTAAGKSIHAAADFIIEPGSAADASPSEVISLSPKDPRNSIVKADDTSQSLITVLHEGTDSAEFTASIPAGYTLSVQPDGSVHLTDEKQGLSFPFIKKPWALDASGKKLITHYTVEGNTLIQHVETENATYPIVADPSVQWVPFPHLALWGYQISMIQVAAAAIAAGGTWVGCTFNKLDGVPGKIVGQICAAVGITTTVNVVKIVSAVANNRSVNPAHPNRGCRSWGLKPPVSSRLRAM
ncbi:hypothetical protein BJ994_000489 [Arthrobacter pigmenti]|uniref:Uncharacterized protein n=1 Tax=Arthrobacter pigmenti TaxID=271432 RepID=A0A846REG0_9MICC|nr:hypothetical protein [Arthrobacter pigmenti]NJC21413.1 hypothetical protein [Arthrobacter pigmenti]